VRAAFEAAGLMIDGYRMGATVSIGAAAALAAGCKIEHLMARADAALYTAKESGRNRVVCAPDEPARPVDVEKPMVERRKPRAIAVPLEPASA
jgi:predicted signal transduction protein with EAL and GGDEF domain